MISNRNNFSRLFLSNNNTSEQNPSNYVHPLSSYTLPCNNITAPSLDVLVCTDTSFYDSQYREPNNILTSQSTPYVKPSHTNLKSSDVHQNCSPSLVRKSENQSYADRYVKHLSSSKNRYKHFPIYRKHLPCFVTCVAPLSIPKRRGVSQKIYIKELSQKSSPARLYPLREHNENIFVVCEAPLSAAPRWKTRFVQTVSSTKLSSRSHSEQFEADDFLATGDTSKLYFGVWELPCPPAPKSLQVNIRGGSAPCNIPKRRPTSSPVFRSTTTLRPNSPRSRSTENQHSRSLSPEPRQKPTFTEGKFYVSQLYSNDRLQGKDSQTSSQGSGTKINVFLKKKISAIQDFRKRRYYLNMAKKVVFPNQTSNFKSELVNLYLKPSLEAKPRNSRSRCRVLKERNTPWVLSKRCSELQCFELNLSPERLFSARWSPSDEHSACSYFHTNTPGKRRNELHKPFSNTDLQWMANQTQLAWSRCISESAINFLAKPATPQRKLPSQRSSSPSLYSKRSTSTSKIIVKLRANNGKEVLCLQKRFRKFVGNLLFHFRCAYYSLGILICNCDDD